MDTRKITDGSWVNPLRLCPLNPGTPMGITLQILRPNCLLPLSDLDSISPNTSLNAHDTFAICHMPTIPSTRSNRTTNRTNRTTSRTEERRGSTERGGSKRPKRVDRTDKLCGMSTSRNPFFCKRVLSFDVFYSLIQVFHR